jgi:hypothetical protein
MENDIIERKSNYGFDDCILLEQKKGKKWKTICGFYDRLYSYDDGISY